MGGGEIEICCVPHAPCRWCRDLEPVINIVGWKPVWEAQEATCDKRE